MSPKVEILFGWRCPSPKGGGRDEDRFVRMLEAGRAMRSVRYVEGLLMVVLSIDQERGTTRAALHARLQQLREHLEAELGFALNPIGSPGFFLASDDGALLRGVCLVKGRPDDGRPFVPLCGHNEALRSALVDDAERGWDEDAWSVKADQLEARSALEHAAAVRMLGARILDPEQRRQAPAIHTHKNREAGPDWIGHRVDHTMSNRFGSKLVEVYFEREEDELVEALLKCQGSSELRYGLTPKLPHHEPETFGPALYARALRPSGDWAVDLRALCEGAFSGGERWADWRGPLSSLSKAGLMQMGKALAEAWKTPPLTELDEVHDALWLQVMRAHHQARVRENLWELQPPVSPARVTAWEAKSKIRLPWLLRAFVTSICGGIGGRWSQTLGTFIGRSGPKTFEAHINRLSDDTQRALLFASLTEAADSGEEVDLEREILREDTSVARTMVLLSFWSDTHDDEGCFVITQGKNAGRVMWIRDLFEGGGTAQMGERLGVWMASEYSSPMGVSAARGWLGRGA